MSKSLKSSYGVNHQIETFFTGVEVYFDQSGHNFYCAHGSVVNKVCVKDGQVKAQIKSQAEDDNVIRFTLSPDENLIVIAYVSGIIVKFNLIDETIEREFRSIHSAPITFLKINQSNTLLATASSDGTIKLWNLKNHYCSHNLKGINGVVTCMLFLESDLGEILICSSGDDVIHLFDLESSKRIVKLSGHCSTITDMQVSPDKKKLISVSRDKIAIVWNIDRDDESGFSRAIRTIPIYESIESMVIFNLGKFQDLLTSNMDPDRLIFATIGEEGLIKFWDTQTGAKIFTQNSDPLSEDRNPGHPCIQLCYRPGHNQICAVSVERDFFFYDLPKLNLVQQLQGHIDEILSACWFADDTHVALASNSQDLKVLNVSTSNCQHVKGHRDIVLCVQPVPLDAFCIISSSKDCEIIVWTFDPKSMSPSILYRATGHTHSVHSLIALNSELIFFSGGEDTTLKKWNLPTKATDQTEKGQLIISSLTVKAHTDRINSLAVSPNDQLIATGSRDKTSKIYSSEDLKLLATLKGHKRGVNAVRFSPVDQVVVTAADVVLRMWNLNDFSCVKTFQGHDCHVLDFNFLSSGLQLLSVGSDGNMKLWDCRSIECTKTIDAHSGLCWVSAITSDGNLVVTGGQDEKVVVWKDTTKEEQEERMMNLQARILQEQDFINYVNKKKWTKALKLALSLENQQKALKVLSEILLEADGLEELIRIIQKLPLDQADFLGECCITWAASNKTSEVAQHVLNILICETDSMLKSKHLDQLRTLTEKTFHRYERLVQDATFVEFFVNSMRIY